MITEDQTAVIDFLAASSTHEGADVEVIDTHASVVFLAGARAWKLKRQSATTIWTSRRQSAARPRVRRTFA